MNSCQNYINQLSPQLKDLVQNINALDPDEYLQFIIASHYLNYNERNVLCVIHDRQKKLCFTSQLGESIWGVDSRDFIGTTIAEYGKRAPFKNSHITYGKAQDYVLDSGNSASFIVLDKFNNLFRAYYVSIDPLFTSHKILCGTLSRNYDFTNLFWGCDNLARREPQITAPISLNLNELGKRQKQVLFLLSLNFTRQLIAESLGISSGGVSRLITSIGKKLHLETSSTNFIFNYISRQKVLEQLELPEVQLEPCCFWIKQEFKTSLKLF